MTPRDRIVEYVLGVGYDCRYDRESGILVVRTRGAWKNNVNGLASWCMGDELVSVPADDYRGACELVDTVVGLRAAGLLQ